MIRKTLFYIFITLSALTLSACGNSSSSGGGGAVTTAPATPANPGAATGDQRVTVTWNSVAGATSYNVYWSTGSGTGTGGTLVNVSSAPFYHDGVINTTPYYYVITAVNGAGESSATAEVSATPAAILLSGLSFTDTNLQACFDAWLVSNPALIYVNELTLLKCSSLSITDITGIEALTSLTSLNLFNNAITDVSPLAPLTSLTFLSLYVNTVTDVGALAGLTNLTGLSLSNNNITDVNALTSLTSLTSLGLGGNMGLSVISINSLLPVLTSLTNLSLQGLAIGDAGLSALAPNFTGLVDLDLSYNTLVNVSPLAGLTGLTYLRLDSNNTITDISPLAGLINLTNLVLGYNTITDVSALAGLTNLTYLDLPNNTIITVSPLASLTSLTELYLQNNSIGVGGAGNVDSLTTLALTIPTGGIYLSGNTGMSCAELDTLINDPTYGLGSPPVDTDNNLATVDVATNTVNCTSP